MKKFLLAFVVPLFLSACGTGKIISVVAPVNGLSQLEQKDGWQVLFDGVSLNGWESYDKPTIGTAWKVEDGAIFFDGASKKKGATGGDIITTEEFENFHFKYDWKIAPNGNSGVMFYVNKDPKRFGATYSSGPEMQVLDNNGHPDAKINKHRAGDLYDMMASTETVKPVGEWNSAEIIADHGKLEFYLNGVKTLSTTMWDENWKNMIANSKFKTWDGFGTFTKGHFALQDHGDNVWFRNIKIRKL